MCTQYIAPTACRHHTCTCTYTHMYLEHGVLDGGVAMGREEGGGRKEAALLWLLAWLVEEKAESAHGRLGGVAPLELVGQRGKEAAVDARARTVLTLKLDPDLGVVEAHHLGSVEEEKQV